MSALPAAVPARSRRASAAGIASPSHIEIVSTRDQRRARPRLVVAVITVGGLFVILAAQLLLSIATSEGAYEIAALQAKQVELARDEQVLAEQMQVLDAPQHLAMQAQSMGMVPSTSAAYLMLADGTVLGSPTAATTRSSLMTASDGSPLVPDALLAGITPLAGSALPSASSAARPGAPAAEQTAGSVASTPPPGIPSPVTH